MRKQMWEGRRRLQRFKDKKERNRYGVTRIKGLSTGLLVNTRLRPQGGGHTSSSGRGRDVAGWSRCSTLCGTFQMTLTVWPRSVFGAFFL